MNNEKLLNEDGLEKLWQRCLETFMMRPNTNAADLEFLNNEYNKTLNLLENVIYDTSETGNTVFTLNAGTYTLSYSGITMNDGAWQIIINGSVTTTQQLASATSITFTINSTSSFRFYANRNMSGAKFMLNEGSTALPYQVYNGKVAHQVDIEPVLLWSGTATVATTLTTQDMSKYKYVVFGYSNATDGNILQYKKVKYQLSSMVLDFVDNDNTTCHRIISITNSTTVAVGTGYAGTTQNQNRCVLKEIYGTNVL